MFWNPLNTSSSQIDAKLQLRTINLSEILFDDDILQELKTSNLNLISFLSKPETVVELVDNITQVTDEDCSNKKIRSKIHAAYVSCEVMSSGIPDIYSELFERPELLTKIIECLVEPSNKVIPQKAALVSKLISALHSVEADRFISHISKNVDSFGKLIDISIENIDVSGCLEILSILIRRSNPSELRYIYCEILNKLQFATRLIEVMTMSTNEDRQRNACQLICDIIMTGRQEAAEQTDSNPVHVRDMLHNYLESSTAVRVMLMDAFSYADGIEGKMKSTAIVCSIKILQTLLARNKSTVMEIIHMMANLFTNGMHEQSEKLNHIEKAISVYLYNFHKLLLNPPQQDPIKTTFGVIQKPLGYIRLEVVNLLRLLITRQHPSVIRKLVELKTMKVVIDLFFEYPWNNLLHTQVKDALCSIIDSCEVIDTDDATETEKDARNAGEPEKENDAKPNNGDTCELFKNADQDDNSGDNPTDETHKETKDEPAVIKEEAPLRALLSQILFECDLVGRLLGFDGGCESVSSEDDGEEPISDQEPKTNGVVADTIHSVERANSGHIIQVIMQISRHADRNVVKEYLTDMQINRPELYDRWQTFVSMNCDTFRRSNNAQENVYRGDDLMRRFNIDKSNEAALNNIYLAFITDEIIPKVQLTL